MSDDWNTPLNAANRRREQEAAEENERRAIAAHKLGEMWPPAPVPPASPRAPDAGTLRAYAATVRRYLRPDAAPASAALGILLDAALSASTESGPSAPITPLGLVWPRQP